MNNPPANDDASPPARPADDDTVDLSDDRGVRRWLDHFGITREQLEQAVQAAGPRFADIDRVLRDQGASAGVG